MSHVLKYAVVRYLPWPGQDQFVNLGVVLESPLGLVYRMVEPRKYRYTAVLEHDELLDLWETLEFSLFRVKELDGERARRNSRTPRRVALPLENAVTQLTGQLQCSDVRKLVVQDDDPHLAIECLNSLYDRYVLRPAKLPRKRLAQPRRLLKPRFRGAPKADERDR